jgi:uncharacterized protein (DUF488 family)
MTPSRGKTSRKRACFAPNATDDSGERAHQLPLPFPFAPLAKDDRTSPPRVLTIGHSNHTAEDFISLLRQHGITTLIDVRSEPYSRYAPHFCRAPLEASLSVVSIAYRWTGDTLGGRPTDPACYHDGIVRKGNVDYRVLARHPQFQAGLQDLLTQARTDQVAIMCSEEDPRRCHRHRLIEPSLREHGVEVLHIRRDGSCETIDEQDITITAGHEPQLMLAGFA